MSSLRPKKSKEDSRTKREVPKESIGVKHESKRDIEKKKKEGESVKKRSQQSQSPFNFKPSPKLSSKPSTKTMSPKSSPKHALKQQSSSLYSSSSNSLVQHSSSYRLSPKPSPTLVHSPKHIKTQHQQQPLVKVSSKISGTEKQKRSDSKRKGEGEEREKKRHLLKESRAQSIQSDDEIVEEITNKEIIDDPIPMEEVSEDIPNQPQDNDDNYDDDYLNEEFEEDYEEDFEEESNHSIDKVSSSLDIEDILQAIGQENEQIEDKSSSLLPVISPTAPPPPSHLSPRPNMTFSAMTQKLKETSVKIKTRANELSTMIERETLTINLFELQPLTEYGLYMRSFGQANTSQTGCQTGFDLIEEETQTDYVSHRECWTQWPPHDMKGYGRVDEDEEEMIVDYDSQKLLKFLQKASQVCEMILEEEEEKTDSHNQNTSSSTTTQQYCAIDKTINVNKSIQCINWSHSHSDMLLVGCLLAESCSGLIKVWNISRTTHPQYFLGDHSIPISCCSQYPLVFAGNDDGTVNVWDLREPLSLHRHKSNEEYTLRAPTYTTAALGGEEQRVIHAQPVIHLETSGVQYQNISQWQSQGLSYQLLSLDASGLICVWVVVELPEGDWSGSPVDLGLAPGGRVKLISSATVNVLSGIDNCIATNMVVSKVDVNTLLIGTDTGSVVCHVRYKSRAVHRYYQLDTEIFNSEVTSISLHPHFKYHFLVGYTSGHIALYHLRWPHPLITWPPSKDRNQIIRDISWHPDWSNVFVCISGDKDIHIWDLLSNDAQPVHSMKLDTRISHLKVLQTSSQQLMAISTAQNVLLYCFIQSSFQQQTEDQFENYLSTLKYY